MVCIQEDHGELFSSKKYIKMVSDGNFAGRDCFLNIRKNVLCFYVWLIGDILWCALDFYNGTYGRSLLNFVQVILAVCGIVSWKKKIKVE